jgi:CubicO group peptidase (beta-lactamase class C family)
MNTFFWIDPSRRLAAVLLTQVLPFADAPVVRLLEEFEGAIYSSLK